MARELVEEYEKMGVENKCQTYVLRGLGSRNQIINIGISEKVHQRM